MSDSGKILVQRSDNAAADIRLASNAAWNLARYTVSWGVLLVVPPFLVRHLRPEVYSTWILLLQFATYYSFVDVNLQTAVARYMARAAALGKDDLSRSFSSILLILSGLAIAVLLIGAAGVIKLHSIFPAIPRDLLHEAEISGAIIVISLGLSLPFTAVVGAFLGLQLNRVVTLAIVLSKLAGGVAMVLVVLFGGSFRSLAVSFAVSTMLAPGAYLVAWNRLMQPGMVGFSHIRRAVLVDFSRYAGALALTVVTSMLISGLALPIVGAYDFSGVPAYSLAIVYANMLLIPQAAILAVMLPKLSQNILTHDKDAFGKHLLEFAEISGATLTVIASALFSIAPLFLKFWVGADIASAMQPIVACLLVSQLFGLAMHPYRIAVLAAGEQLIIIPALFLEGVVSVVLCLTLVRLGSGSGVASATAIASGCGLLFQLLISMPRTRSISIQRWEYLRVALLRPLLSTSPAALFCLTAFVFAFPLWMRLSGGVAAWIISLGLCWRFCMNNRARKIAHRVLCSFKLQAGASAKRAATRQEIL